MRLYACIMLRMYVEESLPKMINKRKTFLKAMFKLNKHLKEKNVRFLFKRNLVEYFKNRKQI